MSLKKIVNAIGLAQSRADRVKRIRAKSTKLVFSDLGFELEKRQLLATYSYSSGLLTIQTDSANEQLSIISTSESGNYTLTTSGSWSGSPVSGLSNTSTSLYVNQPSGLASILINDNGGTVSGSAFSFGSSSANFVDDLTVNFTNATAGSITVGNPASFINGSNLNLTTTRNQITVSSRTSSNSTGAISLTGRNIAVTGNITTAAGDIKLYGNGGGVYQTGSFHGVCISGSTVNVNTTSGNIVIDGRGGLNTACAGVNLTSSKVQAGGSGCVTVTGVSGNGSINANGVFANGANVTTISGSITINGTSCAILHSSSGVCIQSSSDISSSSAGNVTIIGTIANGTSGTTGVRIQTTAKISTTGTGNVTITGTIAKGTTGVAGISVDGSCITTSSGLINFNGTSLATGANSQGVYLLGSANITATSVGNVMITGIATNGTSGANGVLIDGANVTTSSGSITVNGTSCASTSGSSGVCIQSSSNILATSSGNVTITGNSVNGTISVSGVSVSGSCVTISSGVITVNGTSCGTSLITKGVYLNSSARISATGAGNVTIKGIAANGTNNAYGVHADSSTVSTVNGTLEVSGISFGTGTSSKGITLENSSNVNTTGTLATLRLSGTTPGNTSSGVGIDLNSGGIRSAAKLITLNTNTIRLLGNVNATSAGNVTIQPVDSGTVMKLGSTDTAGNLCLTQAELNLITAGNLTIGSNTAGALNVTSNVSWPTNLTIVSGTIISGVKVANTLTQGSYNVTSTGTLILDYFNPMIVTSLADSGNGSLRNAVAYAATNPGNDNITFDSSLIDSTITLASPITINDSTGNLTIVGLGLSNLTISGGGSSGLFQILTPTSISDLTLSNGTGAYGTSPNIRGGAIFSNATVVLDHVAVKDSTANLGSGIYMDGGSLETRNSNIVNSIYVANNGTLAIFDSQTVLLPKITACSLTVSVSNGTIGQSAGSNIEVSGIASFVSVGNISLANSTNNFGTVTACGTNLSISDTNAVVLGTITATGLTVNSGGAITQTGAANVSTGTANFTSSGSGAAGNITLDNASNNFGTVTACATNLSISDTNALTLGSIAGNGTVQISAQNLTITSTVNATDSGTVLLIPASGTVVDLGTKSTGYFGLTSTEIGNITANQLTIGNLSTGNIILSQNINWSSNITLSSNLPTTGTLSNSNRTFTQGSNALTATGTISILSATINYTILISSNAPVTYGTNVLLTASLTHSGGAFNTGTISFYNNGVLLGTSNITNDLANYTWSGMAAASYTNITASGNVTGGTDNGSNTANVVVNQANLTITANNAGKTYDATAFSGGNGVAYSGFVGSENSTALSGTLVYGGDSQGAINAGSYTITPSNLTSTNYNITFANGTLSVATANLIITANGISKTYGDSVTSQMGLQTSGYTVSGLQGIDSLTNVTLSSTGAANTAGAANYNITPSAANSTAISNYNITYTNGTLTVNRYNISVSANNQTKAYGAAVPTLTFTNSPLVNGDSSSVFTGALATTATANSPGGYYPITIGTLSATPNYTISSFTNGTLSEAEELTTVVTISTDSIDPYDNVVTLREAISYGTTLTGNQTVTFSSGIYSSNLSTITLTQGVLTINDNTGVISIEGPTVSSGNLLTISGNDASGIFKFLSDATISNITLSNGTGAFGTSPNIQGGAIYTNATLTLDRMTVMHSTANYGSGMYIDGGSVDSTDSNFVNSIYLANSGNLTAQGSSSTLGELIITSGAANLTGGIISSLTQSGGDLTSVANITGPIQIHNGTARFGGVQGGALNINGGLADVTVNTAIDGLMTVTLSNNTDINANVVGGLYINGTHSSVRFGTSTIEIGNTTVSANTSLVIPENTTLSSLDQSNGTILIHGRITQQANLTGGALTSNGTISRLIVTNAFANLTGGRVIQPQVNSGIIETTGTTITSLEVYGGIANVTGGNACAVRSCGTLNILDNAYIGFLEVNNGVTTVTGNNTSFDAYVYGGVANLSGNSTSSVWVNGATSSVTISTSTQDVRVLQSNFTNINANVTNSLRIEGPNANVTIDSTNIQLGDTSILANSVVSIPANTTLANLSIENSVVTLNGNVTNQANVTSGNLASTGHIGSLIIDITGIVNISNGTVGATDNSGTLHATGGTFTSIRSSNTTHLNSSVVTGLSNITAGTFTANSTLAAVKVSAGTANLTGGTASNLTQSGGTVTSVANITGFANLSNGTTTILSDGKIEGTTTVTGTGHLTSNGSLHDLYAQSGFSVSINLTGGTVTGGLYQSVGTVSSIANITGVANLNGGTTAINNGGIIGGTTTVNNGSLTSNGVLSEGLLLTNGTATFNGGTVNRTGNNSAIVVNNGTLTAQNTTINGATGATANTPTVYISGGSVSLSNNTLTLGNSTRYLLFNNATANVSAIGNTWNGVNTTTANLSQLYDTVDRIIDSVDVGSLGLVRIKANNVYVTKESFYTPLSTTAADVQRGVDIASVGDTVNVETGDYNVTSNANNGVVSVSKNLTISGDGVVVTSVRAFVLNNSSNITTWSGISSTSNVTIHSGAVINNATSTPTLVSLIDSNGSLIFDSGATYQAQLSVVNKNLTITSNTSASNATINTIGSGSANTAISLSGTGNITLTDLTLGGTGSALNATNTGSLTIDRLALTAGLANLTTGVKGAIANTGSFTYNGQTASTNFTFNATGMSTSFFNSQFLSLSPTGNVTINSFAGNDNFTIDRIMLATTINGGAGNDVFSLGTTNPTSNTSSVTMINGETGNNTLNGPVGRANVFTLTGNGTGTLNTNNITTFSGIQNIAGGTTGDTVVVNRGAIFTSITGGGGIDTIQVDSNAGDTVNMTISGSNTGNITGTSGTSVGVYTGISHLIGTAGNDTFKFIDNASLLTGSLNGGTGTNAINYTGTTKPTFVNLTTGQATGVTTTTNTGVATNIQDLFGGTGADYFSGSSAANVMDGGSGNDTLLGLSGNDILVGNYGQDLINGGAGYDILIGGFINFVSTIPNATLQTGLQTIMTSWITVATDSDFNSVSNTLNTASSSQYRLVGDTSLASTWQLQTVFNDQSTDTLIDIASSSVPNWFFATERVTQGNDVVQAGTTFTVSKKTVTSKTARSAR